MAKYPTLRSLIEAYEDLASQDNNGNRNGNRNGDPNQAQLEMLSHCQVSHRTDGQASGRNFDKGLSRREYLVSRGNLVLLKRPIALEKEKDLFAKLLCFFYYSPSRLALFLSLSLASSSSKNDRCCSSHDGKRSSHADLGKEISLRRIQIESNRIHVYLYQLNIYITFHHLFFYPIVRDSQLREATPSHHTFGRSQGS